jgi:hypothetical protein
MATPQITKWALLDARKKGENYAKAKDKNSTIVRDILADLKSNKFSERDTCHPFLDLHDMILNLLRLRGEHWALSGSQLTLAREMSITA